MFELGDIFSTLCLFIAPIYLSRFWLLLAIVLYITGCLECILLNLNTRENGKKKLKLRKLQNCKLSEARNFNCIWVWFKIRIITCTSIYWFQFLSSFAQPQEKNFDKIFNIIFLNHVTHLFLPQSVMNKFLQAQIYRTTHDQSIWHTIRFCFLDTWSKSNNANIIYACNVIINVILCIIMLLSEPCTFQLLLSCACC